ncbi:MAG: glucose-6-phosphate dehydrogenase [Elusimicrobia bacterium]|nr:glucose-6-phosphate dehydrogenase [Elusimicrobiota bacterium]
MPLQSDSPRATIQTKIQEQFCIETRPDPCGLVIFGASGDLAERKLFPSLFHLRRSGLLPKQFYAIGMGRTPLSDDSFRAKVLASLKKSMKDLEDDSFLREFLSSFYYFTGQYDDSFAYQALASRLKSLDETHQTRGNRVFYLSIPPSLYRTVFQRLGEAHLAQEGVDGRGWSRLIVEKPFGRDLASARELNKQIRSHFKERQIYRIDHYLGKETVQNVMVLRFANIMFEPIWNRNFVDHVEITAAEDIGIGHRAGYFEEAGTLRDMFQNHLLQLLCITAMEPPGAFVANRVRDEKSKVLRAIRPIRYEDVPKSVIRGQYGPGLVNGKNARGYRDEPGVSPDSLTETFAAMRLFVDNWRWRDVPFYLRSGKRMAKRVSEIAVHFKAVPHLIFEPIRSTDILANTLVLRIQPEEGISLSFETKHPGPKLCMSCVTMDFNYESSFGEPPEAYERLFLDCMAGDQMLFIREDSVNLSWALMEPILARWKEDPAGPALYEAGSWGPEHADGLLAEFGHCWRNV